MTKALFFDIDGTLVSFQTHRIPSSTIKALELAHAKGIKIFIATGRATFIITNLSELQQRNLIDGYITMNGSYCFVDNQVIYKNPIPAKDVKAMVDIFKEKGYSSFFVSERRMVVCQPNDLLRRIFYESLHVDESPESSFEEILQEDILQATSFFTEQEEKAIRPHIPDCEIARWHPAFTDITAKGNTKQKGIDEFCRHFGFRLEETMAFGDGGNDISMLRHAAIGIAMGQAKEEVKQSADYVTAPVDEDGIWKAMKHFEII